MTKLAGIPVVGTPYYTSPAIEQKPIELLMEPLKELLEMDGVDAVRWRQYTPYFNDGEPCVFGVHEASIRVSQDVLSIAEEDTDYGDGYISEWSMYTGVYKTTLSNMTPDDPNYEYFANAWDKAVQANPKVNYVKVLKAQYVSNPKIKSILDKFEGVNTLLQSGAFEHQLLAALGDHAVVTATKDAITVEQYDHD